jgi:iron(III) transport system substrate-binding protein
MPIPPRGLILAACLTLLACTPTSQPSPAAPAPSPTQYSALSTQYSSSPSQQEWDQTVAAARREGKVVVLATPGDHLRENLVGGFRKAFPDITVEYSGGQSPDQAVKLEAERRAGVYTTDVFLLGTAVALQQVKPTGAADPVKPALILPEVTDTSLWRDNRLDFSDRDETNLVFSGTPAISLLYDPKQVRPDEIDEFPDLLNPRWKERIAMEDPTVGGLAQGRFRFVWYTLGPERATEYIRAIRAQAGVVDRDRRRLIEWVARGRYPILFNPQQSLAQQLQQEGLEFGMLVDFKDHGTEIGAGGGSLVLLNRAPNPNAARVFVNWLLTKEGQTAYATAVTVASRRLDVPTSHLPPDFVPKPGVRYATHYKEDYVVIPPELTNLFKELFPS